MMRRFIALLLAVMLVGCSSSWVTASDHGTYSFYRNGKLVCESTNSCKISSSGKEMLVEVRKDDIVYGHTLVVSESSKHGTRSVSSFISSRDMMNTASSMSDHTQAGAVFVMFVGGGLILGALLEPIIDLMIPRGVGRLPENMTIPVGVGADSVAAFPWDQPAKD